VENDLGAGRGKGGMNREVSNRQPDREGIGMDFMGWWNGFKMVQEQEIIWR